MLEQTLYKIYLMDLAGGKIDPKNVKEENLPLKDLEKLLKRNFLSVTKDGFFQITENGMENIHLMLTYPTIFQEKHSAWVREVETGTTAKGKETKIYNAVIPRRELKEEPCSEIDISDIDNNRIIKTLSRKFGIEEIHVAYAMNEGRVKFCSGCKNLSIFSESKTRSGGLQGRCKICNKGHTNHKN